MTDIVYNNMMKFQFFCNHVFKQKNIDKLVPNGMSYTEWNTQKEAILNEEIESTSRYLQQEAATRMESLPVADKEELSERFQDIIMHAIGDYKDKLYHHHQ